MDFHTRITLREVFMNLLFNKTTDILFFLEDISKNYPDEFKEELMLTISLSKAEAQTYKEEGNIEQSNKNFRNSLYLKEFYKNLYKSN